MAAPPAEACFGDCSNDDAQMVGSLNNASPHYGQLISATVYMTDLTVTCTITPGGACDVPNGRIDIAHDGNLLGSDVLVPNPNHDSADSIAQPQFSATPGGQHTLLFQYVPGPAPAGFRSNSLLREINVSAAGTQTTMSPTSGPTVAGQPVTLSAKVLTTQTGIDYAHGARRPTGNISFLSNGSEFASANVDEATGVATLPWSFDGGVHALSARYNTDFNYEASTSTNPVTHTVNKGDATSVLSQTANATVYGQSFTLTDTVTATPPAVGPPTGGQVQFFRNGTPIASQALAAGVASTNPVLVPGGYSLSAVYAGNDDFNGSTSNTLTHTVSKASTTTALTSPTANPSTLGQPVVLNAAIVVTSPGTGTATGTVQFKDGAASLGAPVTVTANAASLTTLALGGGAHSITAVYSGDTNFNGSSSAPLTRTVTCNNNVSGTVNGSYNVPATGTTCITNANITGGVNIPAGAKVSIVNSTIGSYLMANSGASTIIICGTTVPGITINNAAGAVTIGDPVGACVGNILSSSIALGSNHGGVRVLGNRIAGGLNATGNNGGPTVIGGNTITGWLQCSGNTSVTNEGRPNTAGGRTGQCATPANF